MLTILPFVLSSYTSVTVEFALWSALCLSISSKLLNIPATINTTNKGMRTVGTPLVLLIVGIVCRHAIEEVVEVDML